MLSDRAAAINTPRRRILERHPIVGLHGRVAGVACKIARSAREQRQQAERGDVGIDPDRGQQCRRRAFAGPGGERGKTGIDRAVAGVVGSNEQQIPVADQPHRALRKHRRERSHDGLQILRADVIGVRPLAEEAAWLEAIARRLEELAGEQRRHARHPRVRRLRDDHIVAARREQQVRAAVADDEADAGLRQHAAALGVEEARRGHDLRRDLDHVDVFDGAGRQRGPDRDAAAESDHRERPCLPVQQHRQEPEHALGQHVGAVARVHFAVDGERSDAGDLPHADGCGRSLLVELQRPRAQHRFEIARLKVGRVLVGAAGKQRGIPPRQGEDCSHSAETGDGGPDEILVARAFQARDPRP